MQTIIVDNTNSGKKLDKILRTSFPKMPNNALYKAFRKKDIKVNGKRESADYIVRAGDVINIYIIDNILYGLQNISQIDFSKKFNIIYEDENLIIVNKFQGIAVHSDNSNDPYSLIDLLIKYVNQKNLKSSFTPALCHRLDRNTGGLLLVAKNEETLSLLLKKMRDREIHKYYKCLAYGKFKNPSGTLKAYLYKNKKISRVFIKDIPEKNSLEILTKYKVLSYKNNISTLEIELLTGRTHQIRAHLSHIGHPIIGDGKYGTNLINDSYPLKFQALWAYKLKFSFSDKTHLDYLNNKTFEVRPEFI